MKKRLSSLVPILALVGFALLVFRSVLGPESILFCTDDNIGEVALRRHAMPEAFQGCWRDIALMGVPVFLHVCWTNLWMWLLPPELFSSVIHALDLVVCSIGVYLFLRDRGLTCTAALLGGLVSCWMGSNFYLVYAGHIGKFGALAMASLGLLFAGRALSRWSFCYALLAGGTWGAMFLEQPDLALFFALVFGPWVLWTAMAKRLPEAPSPLRRGLIVAVLGLGLALLAAHPVLTARALYGGTSPGEGQGDAAATWDYATQWSWPPDETIEWLAPGYMGWRSGEPDGPYWGRLGRSAGWEQTRQGFMNFKLETFYMGSIPIIFFLLGASLAFSRRFAGANRRELIFWSAAAAVTFLLGLGKFFPLYKLFFALPGMSSIRNPVKFMQVAQLAIGIVAAYGLDALLRRDPKTGHVALPNWFRWVALGLASLLLLAAFSTMAGQDEKIRQFASTGWGQYAPIIVGNQVAGLLHAAILGLLAWAFIQFVPRLPVAWSGRAGASLIALVMLDLLTVSPHYVNSVRSEDLVGKNAVTEALEGAAHGGQRAYVVVQDNFYNHWLTYLFPYHGICTFNVTQIRMPEDYQRYLAALQRQPDRLWRLSGVGHLLAPAKVLPQLEAFPGLHGQLKPGLGFNVLPGNSGGVTVTMPQPGQQGEHLIADIAAPAPRYALIAGWTSLDDSATLAALASPASPLFERAHVAPESAPGLIASARTGLTGTVAVLSYRPGRVVLKTESDAPAILRAAERFTPDWKARIDGQPADLLRVDYMVQGVAVPAGVHTVELAYRPPTGTLNIQLFGMGACLLALLLIPLESRFSRPVQPTRG